jgi:hypothetical protein
LNGYGHYWEARLNDDGDVETGRINLGGSNWSYVYGPHWTGQYSDVVFRNYDHEPCNEAYRFGINVVVHLLVRYQDKFLLVN